MLGPDSSVDMADGGSKQTKPTLGDSVPGVKGYRDVSVKQSANAKQTTSSDPEKGKTTVTEKTLKRQRFKARNQPLLPDAEPTMAPTSLLEVIKESSMDFSTSRLI